MIRLGLCCLFIKAPIRFRKTTVTYLLRLRDRGENPLVYVDRILDHNITALDQAVDYCYNHCIKAFRVGSDLMPGSTHPEAGYTLQDLPRGNQFIERFQLIGAKAKKHNLRLSFHPDQFVILNSPKDEVNEKSIRELEHHGTLAEWIGVDVINIHGGGAYNDKQTALKRFETNFSRLSFKVQSRLTLENDDKVYTPEDLLPLCHHLAIPLVYDAHHHRCLKDSFSIEKATELALVTWNREPLFHISSPIEGWKGPKPYRHHDFININDMPQCWKEIQNLTIEVEAKAKEEAVLKLREELKTRKWPVY